MPKEISQKLPPTWAMILGSVAILCHFICALISALNSNSGPWPLPNNIVSMADPPQFAFTAGEMVSGYYQRILKNTSAFRFTSIKQEVNEIMFDAVIRDANGVVVAKRSIPDPEAPEAIRYRQRLLAQQLGNDIPLPPPEGVIIAPAGQKLPTLRWWQPENDRNFILRQDNPNAVPRNQEFRQPNPWQFIVAKSYARYLSRQYANSKIELRRYWYDPVFPMVLIENTPPTADILRRFQSSYGELSQ